MLAATRAVDTWATAKRTLPEPAAGSASTLATALVDRRLAGDFADAVRGEVFAPAGASFVGGAAGDVFVTLAVFGAALLVVGAAVLAGFRALTGVAAGTGGAAGVRAVIRLWVVRLWVVRLWVVRLWAGGIASIGAPSPGATRAGRRRGETGTVGSSSERASSASTGVCQRSGST